MTLLSIFNRLDSVKFEYLYSILYINKRGDRMDEKTILTIDELAEYLRVKKRTVYDWVKKGKIPAIKTVGQWRFRKDKIEEWLETHN